MLHYSQQSHKDTKRLHVGNILDRSQDIRYFCGITAVLTPNLRYCYILYQTNGVIAAAWQLAWQRGKWDEDKSRRTSDLEVRQKKVTTVTISSQTSSLCPLHVNMKQPSSIRRAEMAAGRSEYQSHGSHLWPCHINLILSKHLDEKENGFDVSTRYLFTDHSRHRNRERANVATAEVFPFPLVAEELQFSLLLVIQAVTVSYLHTHTYTHLLLLPCCLKCDADDKNQWKNTNKLDIVHFFYSNVIKW